MLRYNRTRWNSIEKENVEALQNEGIPFKYVTTSTVVIRIDGIPKIDFYVSRNKWKVSDEDSCKSYNSDTKGFINWFKKRYSKRY